MKNLLLILVCVMAFASAKANHLPTVMVDADKSFVLDLNDWNKSILDVSIINDRGVELYEDTILPTEGRMKKFNLKFLPKGEYNVVVSDEYKSVSYEVKVSNTKVVSISEGTANFIPQVRLNDGNIDINLMALSKKVNISLLDQDGNQLYGEKIKDLPTISKRLNIAKLERGSYTLQVNVGNNWYTQRIKL